MDTDDRLGFKNVPDLPREQEEDKIMARKKSEVPEMEKMLQYGRKKFVRYDEGAKIYSMGLHTFQDLAKE